MDDEIDFSAQRRQNHKRASDEQKVYLVNFMSNHLELANNIINNDVNPSDERKLRFNLWRKLSTELNALPGAYKDMSRWKKCWGDLKLNAKGKYKKHRKRLEENDLETYGKDCLNGLDERILQIAASKPVVTVAQISNCSQSYDAPIYVQGEVPNDSKDILETHNNPTEGVTVKVETIDIEDSLDDESNSSNSPLEDIQQDTQVDDTLNRRKFLHKSKRKNKRSKIYRKIQNEVSELKGTLLKEFIRYKNDKLQVERQKLQLETQKLQFERRKHAFEKNIIAERHSIESQKVNALLSISTAINTATDRGSAIPFVPETAVGYYYQENEMG